LRQHGIRISMDGKGRALDNVFVEWLWRTVKYEHVYLRPAETGTELKAGLRTYFDWYNAERPHSSLGD
ncbi:transposase, partial [Acidithiobacillus sp. CV18-2]|nr:transposase [Acidithiobacillus sp. CV18-2]